MEAIKINSKQFNEKKSTWERLTSFDGTEYLIKDGVVLQYQWSYEDGFEEKKI